METKSISYSNISIDSLEIENKKKSSRQEKAGGEIVDTILVPFYENDVLIKVPKGKRNQRQMGNKVTRTDTCKEEGQCTGYLMNNNLQRNKRVSYLEMFRKQFSSSCNEKVKKDPNEIRSISPECGDTERESFGEEYNSSNVATEFYNTEAYNEMFYDKIMNQELAQYIDQSFEEDLHLGVDVNSRSPVDIDDNNLRSVSEVSRPRRHVRRITVPISQNIQLGGLGPDMENIRPRLERAKSLQRYSEKVRMENRVKIYKKEIEAENEKKAEKEAPIKRRGVSAVRNTDQKGKKSSYLIEKTQQKTSVIKKMCAKPKPLHVKGQETKDSNPTSDTDSKNEKESKPSRVIERKLLSAKDNLQKYIKAGYDTTKKKSSARSQGTEQKQISTMSPIEIKFTVNVGGVRPSSALKSLEEKHRLYQEKVKGYSMEPNNA